MNNRHGGASARNAGGLSRARAASAQTAFAATSSTSQTTSSSSVRRNLFQNQLTRRPTPASSAEASSQEKEAFTISSGGGSDLSDIVVRGRNGEIELDETPLVPVEGDADEVAIDMMVENQSTYFSPSIHVSACGFGIITVFWWFMKSSYFVT